MNTRVEEARRRLRGVDKKVDLSGLLLTDSDLMRLIPDFPADAVTLDLTGSAPTYGGVPGSTDGTILNARKGIPIVTCGPGDIHIPHHIDEWVSIDEIKTAAKAVGTRPSPKL